ncbi:hypothetical protein HY629_03005 [Candidatus Uhrbacteria bacterium]|nr:hypothetical protein [Candidatus Uhrbacteria bacterium]
MVRLCGRWRVSVRGCGQTSTYSEKMWRTALKQLPKTFRPRRILMLGLGAAGEVRTLHKRFPGCHIVVIERDPEMIRIAKELRLHAPYPFPEIVLADARDIARCADTPHDLVLVDLFEGPHPSALLQSEQFLKNLTAAISPQGWLVANVYDKPEMLNALDQIAARESLFTFRMSTLGIYRRHGSGVMGDPPPKDFFIAYGDPTFLVTDTPYDAFHLAPITCNNVSGIMSRLGPLRTAYFLGDTEPHVDRSVARLVRWQRVARRDAPRGWHHMPGTPGLGRTAYTRLDNEYTQQWSIRARRHLKQYARSSFHIEEIDTDAYGHAHRESSIYRVVREKPLIRIHKRIQEYGKNFVLYGVRDDHERVVAGLGVLYLPKHGVSVHVTAFTCDPSKNPHASVGLIDHWYRESLTRGMRYLDFGLMAAPGYPTSWGGFSHFKEQFGLSYIVYPPALVQFNW